MRLGTALYQRGAPKDAERELRKAVELDPACLEAWVNLGGVLLSRWDFEGCVAANQKAVECDPNVMQAHYNLGLGYLYLGQAEQMVGCFRRAIELESDHPAAHYHLAVGLLSLGEEAEARQELARAVALGFKPQPEFLKALDKAGKRGGQAPTNNAGSAEKKGPLH
jgi:tetratricopeptide (TPR) repeat protein